MLGEGELFGASVINAETGRPLAKVDEDELTFGVFPSSLFSCPALCLSSFSLAWSRSYLDSSFIWVSSQLIPTRLWADKDLDMPIQTGIYILKMNFWSWDTSAINRACQSGGWDYRLLSCHSADLHWADPGPFAFQDPVATPETNSFPWGDAPALYFSIIGKKKKKKKDWEGLTSQNKSFYVSLIQKRGQTLGNQSWWWLLCISWQVRTLCS